MSAYEIKRWDAVTDDNILKRPMIYIEPDDAFLQFARANKFAVLCEISGTGMNYDHTPGSQVKIPGVVNTSAIVPNCRPNYYSQNKYYVITLLAPWIGYPHKSMGTVKFFGLEAGLPKQLPTQKGDRKTTKPFSIVPATTKTTKSEKTSISKQTKIIIGISGLILVLLIIICIIAYVYSRSQ